MSTTSRWAWFAGKRTLFTFLLAFTACGVDMSRPEDVHRGETPFEAAPIWFSSPLASEASTVGEVFGGAVALSGNTAVISSANAAHIFTRSDQWRHDTRLELAEPSPDGSFGSCVAISGDTVAVGAPRMAGAAGERQGAVFVFERTGMTFAEPLEIRADGGAADDEFGCALALDGDTLAVGAIGATTDRGTEDFDVHEGAVDVFTRSGGAWPQTKRLSASDGRSWDLFGQSVALSGDTIVVGAPIAPNADGSPYVGAAYVFGRSGGVWSDEPQKLTPEDQYMQGEFGNAVSIDGPLLVVGAWRSFAPTMESTTSYRGGAAYVYADAEGRWDPFGEGLFADDSQELDQFGKSVALSGDTVMVSTENADSVYVFAPKESAAPVQVLGGRGSTLPFTGPLALDGTLGILGVGKAGAVPQMLELALDRGADCETDDDCNTRHCADGVCCNEACDGRCESCATGTCTPLPQDQDPPPCAPYLCASSGGDCPMSCSSSDDCVDTTYCHAGACDPKRSNGKTCSASRDCASDACVDGRCAGTSKRGTECSSDTDCESGHCTDGVCCDDACSGQCEACDVKGAVGTCSAVTGRPRGDREGCDGDALCAGACDGRQRSRCSYPDGSESCAESCADGVRTQSFCDGKGACREGKPASCDGYGCADERSCRTSCASHSECATGFTCGAEGTCESRAVCLDAQTSLSPDGNEEDCGTFRCGPEGICLTACSSQRDCSGDNVCDREGGRCGPLPATEPPAETAVLDAPADSGCACSTPARSRGASGGLAVLLAAGVLGGFRRRRGRALPRCWRA
jgi:hypothetical protein